MSQAYLFISGAATMGFLVASLFFLRFWASTRDRLFAAFAAAFLLLGLNQILVALADVPQEDRALFYLLRLTAFAIIIWAVVQKNRRG